jgi:hypothetical protein
LPFVTVVHAQIYLGSEACAECHPEIYNDFRVSGHPYKLMESAKARNRPIPLPEGYTWDDITYVIGGYKWKSRYMGVDGYIITSTADGTEGMNQWNYLTRRWVDYHPGELKPYDCGRCHTTGYSSTGNQDGLPGIVGTWAFGGIQCEACHGAGGHFEPIDDSAAACGTCHIRGDADTIPARGGFIRHHEQYNEFLASPHADLDCVSCHDPHKQSATSIHTTCQDCHSNVAESYAGTVMDQWDVTCEDCHLALASKSADALGLYRGDVQTHLFDINTDASANLFTEDGNFVALDGSGKAGVTLDFACLACHQTETRQWAAIYARNFHGSESVQAPRAPRVPRISLGIFH